MAFDSACQKTLFNAAPGKNYSGMQTRVLTIETAGQFRAAVAEAVALLRAGQVVALPTETVYGLAANAFDTIAVETIYRVKGRPAQNPLIVHVASLDMARQCAAEWPEQAEALASHFWPGPLTLVLPRAPSIPDIVTASGSTVGVRIPLHPFMRRVIEGCRFPLAAPSANHANQLSPTTAEHVLEALGGSIPLIVDAGLSSVGIESTVLDLSSTPPRVLRPGMISSDQIGKVLGMRITSGKGESSELKSPGLFQKHYSPRARMMVVSWKNADDLGGLAKGAGVKPEVIHVIAYEQIPEANPFGRVAIVPHDADAYARALYAELHRSDQLGAELILVEAPPPGPEWEGIHDRLRRASA